MQGDCLCLQTNKQTFLIPIFQPVTIRSIIITIILPQWKACTKGKAHTRCWPQTKVQLTKYNKQITAQNYTEVSVRFGVWIIKNV